MCTFNKGPFWKTCFSSQTTQYSLSVGILCSAYLMICGNKRTSHIYLMKPYETCHFIIYVCMCMNHVNGVSYGRNPKTQSDQPSGKSNKP